MTESIVCLPADPETQEAWDAAGRTELSDFLDGDQTLRFPVVPDPAVSIIMVLHNKAHLSLLCLKSLKRHVDVQYELVIVDNDSTDETRELLSRCLGAKVILNYQNAGFGEACMQAANHSTGELLLFLNNDALLQPCAISAATHNFADESVGAVGGKILLSNGALQEAGSIIWSDGSALGYGRLENPCLLPYEFRRPVDYCSGAFLFTRRELFLALGGFDPCYSPAYYEDADYCLKVWQRGFRVLYEPRAVIRHYESASSGGNQNAQLRMARNRGTFIARWAPSLARHSAPSAQNVWKARIATRAKGLRIVYLEDRVPHRRLGAGYPRSNDILRCLAAEGHHVTCVSLHWPCQTADIEYQDIPRDIELLDMAADPFAVYRNHLALADIAWVSRPTNFALFLDRLVPQFELNAKLIFDAEAIFSRRDAIHLSVSGRKMPPRINEIRLKRELLLAQAADAVVTVSEGDGELFRSAGITNLHTIAYSLSPQPTIKPFCARRTILFVGAIHSPGTPNSDSMDYFCREIWPEVRKRTGAQFVIAGFGTDQHLKVQGEGIRILGPVPDLRALFDDARVFVIPTRFSGGIPLKAHESASNGVPMVVSKLIGEQLGWRDEDEVLVADTPGRFAEACCRLYDDPELWTKLRVNALTRIALDFDWDAFTGRVRDVIRTISKH